MSSVTLEDAAPPRSFTPAIARLYRPLEPWAYAVLRAGTAAIIIPHGWQKLFGHAPSAAGRFLTPWNLPASADWAMAIGGLELAGGILLLLGLLTRPVALLLAIEFAVATFGVPRELAWWGKGATEHYTLLLTVLCAGFVFRGGGLHSLDRRIGKEF
jgi:putative oxidoreductase